MPREAKVAWMHEHRHAMVAAQPAGHPHMIEVGVGEEHRGEITRARPEHVQDAYQQRPRAGKTCIDEGKAVVSFEQVAIGVGDRSEEHTSELQSRFDIVCRLLLEKKKQEIYID